MRCQRLLLACLVTTLTLALTSQAKASCAAPANPIEAENCLTGTPQTTWDICGSAAGDATIQGFATDISVNVGQTISFKINTHAAYKLDIYRMGYYQGNGARLINTIRPSVPLPQPQPACLTDAYANLVDCGNWAVSASWTVPANATSGIYFAKVTRTDTGGASHIVFIVRNDASTSHILFQTADETWQVQNDYGGSRFLGRPGALELNNYGNKVSYNRPFRTSFVSYAEYPIVGFLEAKGYDVSYFTSVDAARSGSLIMQHKAYISAGHDDYWSGPKRASIETARSAGVYLVLFSGNEGMWKTRWENSIDGTNTPYRTLAYEGATQSHWLPFPFPFRASRRVERVLPDGTEDLGNLARLTVDWERSNGSFSLAPVARTCSPNAAR